MNDIDDRIYRSIRAAKEGMDPGSYGGGPDAFTWVLIILFVASCFVAV